ncbi:hypothetical protein J2752_002702 [Halarchaeum rubridurum]|uniref:Uncharacterized protein n=1 Tax=Halarchaeum rubridurum TaxID=489911 RepID=A0A830G3R9_9EURY|nr:hypothetical protein [Halarchaeum rubridurum]MBP1955773.1 hypothetical protein [Halarchaeum rubridurum]GGM74662.1 hypothetical protein GCM10009017_25770 [Halarchaeum rubridurum]
MQTATRVRLAAALCAALGALGAATLLLRDGLARPVLLAACAMVLVVAALLYRRADGAESRRPGW